MRSQGELSRLHGGGGEVEGGEGEGGGEGARGGAIRLCAGSFALDLEGIGESFLVSAYEVS